MWRLRNCPRCGGDIYIKRSTDGWEEQCLQCSYVRYKGRQNSEAGLNFPRDKGGHIKND